MVILQYFEIPLGRLSSTVMYVAQSQLPRISEIDLIIDIHVPSNSHINGMSIPPSPRGRALDQSSGRKYNLVYALVTTTIIRLNDFDSIHEDKSIRVQPCVFHVVLSLATKMVGSRLPFLSDAV